MRTGRPRTALEALAWRPLLATGWPWRSAGYLLATLPVALVAAVSLAVPAAPWLALAAGGHQAGAVVLLVLAGAVLVAAAGPLIAIPVTAFARRRRRLVDLRPASAVRLKSAPGGPAAWLRARYTDPAAWRQTGYACLLATVIPALSVAVLLAAPLAAAFIASPFLVMAQQPGSAPVALGFSHVATVAQALPYLLAGLVLLPAAGYLVTLARARTRRWPGRCC